MTRINNVFAVQEDREILEVFTRRSTASAFADRLNEGKEYGEMMAMVIEKPIVRGTQEVADEVYERDYAPDKPEDDTPDTDNASEPYDPMAFLAQREGDEPSRLITGRPGYGRTVGFSPNPDFDNRVSLNPLDYADAYRKEDEDDEPEVPVESKHEQVVALVRELLTVLEGTKTKRQ